MPHVIDDTETLEHAAASDTIHAHTLPRSPLMAAVGRVFAALWRRRAPESRVVSGSQQFELPLDRLAREHPDLYLRLMTGIG